MFFDGLKSNIKQMKDIARELYVFYYQLENISKLEVYGRVIIDNKEKQLLNETIISLINQLRILNNSILGLVGEIKLYNKLSYAQNLKNSGFSNITYESSEDKKVSLVISEEDKKEFLRNLNISRLSINQLKSKYSIERNVGDYRKPSQFAKIANYFFRNFSERLASTGYFNSLNNSLRKMSSRFVLATYVSMLLYLILVSFIISVLLLIFLLFFNVSFIFPFISLVKEPFFTRFLEVFWIVITIPLLTGIAFYLYPSSEASNVGNRINQELPFITIHMSAIASSGINPTNIFSIIVKSGEYKYTTTEFKKLLNLINFHGIDIVSALRKSAMSSPSSKLSELYNGLAFTIKSGGNIHDFLKEHVETMLFDYRLERERYTRVSETFMDIYISIAIAAPMIFLTLFIIIGSTGLTGGLFNLGTNTISLLLIMTIILLNVVFLVILKLKQPPM